MRKGPKPYRWDFDKKKVSMEYREYRYELLMSAICTEFEVSSERLTDKTYKNRNLSDARMIFAVLCKRLFDSTLVRIGKELGQNHSSITYQLQRWDGLERLQSIHQLDGSNGLLKRAKLIEEKLKPIFYEQTNTQPQERPEARRRADDNALQHQGK